MEDLIIRYVHFLGIILLSCTLFAELITLSPTITNAQFKKLVWIDALFGLSAIIVLVAGGLLWAYFAKPSEFYTKNWIFHLKLAVFFTIALLSLFPTLYFLKNRKSELPVINVPRYIVNVVRIEFALLLTIPLLAVLMARGYGLAH